MCPYLVGEISDLQSVGLATVGEVQTVVTFRGEQAVLETLLGDVTCEERRSRQGGTDRHRQLLALCSSPHWQEWGHARVHQRSEKNMTLDAGGPGLLQDSSSLRGLQPRAGPESEMPKMVTLWIPVGRSERGAMIQNK